MNKLLLLLIIFIFSIAPGFSQGKEYSDGHGGKVKLPQGDISFADKLISFTKGNPAPIKENSNGNLALGVPDYNEETIEGFVSLGTGGELILEFSDNALVNIEGPDMYVFELGKYVEETFLYVSEDGKNWISVGKISGGKSVVDIGDSTEAGSIFRFVKLVDAKTATNSKDLRWPGADIDAVAAIGSAKKLSLNSTYLFNSGQFTIKENAKKELKQIVSELKTNPNYDLVIYGHTDSIGKKSFNQKLSSDRSNAIKNYILSQAPELKNKIKFRCEGFADVLPAASNSTEDGREKNRRVEIFFIPFKN